MAPARVKVISDAAVLGFCDVNKEVTIECDRSDVGLGAVATHEGKPVAYSSRALTATQRNYAQIEKEYLAIVFAAHRFGQYLMGRDKITVRSDHQSLKTVFSKSIIASPKHLQKIRLQLQKYPLVVEYKPECKMYVSNTLLCASLPIPQLMEQTPDCLVYSLRAELDTTAELEDTHETTFVSDECLERIRAETKKDVTL